ncbi:hypothetical protein FOQG_03964 [Fusarium oxysporum f. sp. raphani 54005]|uniref:Uncharacterized protein n=1 Tax=Fusarium oxysporum f. sp. raphani 54005 TaxID=1089458 RepID=X0CMH2_FUSOX|nr:hypothetical protein FOQG_03964 [Fusarium oxysporum f. sp. raphani 54005]
MWDTFFYRGAFVISAIPGLIGINSMLRPEATLEIVKFPHPGRPSEPEDLPIPHKKLMGMGLLGALFMLATDGFVSKSLIGGNEWFHWGYIPVFVAFIGGLLYSE